MKKLIVFVGLISIFGLYSCKPAFQPIDYGKDGCAHCKMTIMDKKFAAEMVDKKGKAFKFDDIKCMKDFISGQSLNDDGLMLFVADYKHPDSAFIDAQTAWLLKAPQFKSPMGGDMAAFINEAEANQMQIETKAQIRNWGSIE